MPPRLPFESVADFAAAAFERVGLPMADARAVAGLMVEAQAQGSEGHGLLRLSQYIRRIRAGGVNVKPTIRVVEERAAMALVDGDNGMGHLVMRRVAESTFESDLLSYLLFDGEFAAQLIALGRKDAQARHQEFCKFFETLADESRRAEKAG